MHFVVPAVIVFLFFRHDWKFAYFLMISTMLVDLDHLLANPIYDPERCSIGFHPLHSFVPITLYAGLSFVKKYRLHYMGIGLMIHMALDSVDCQVTNGVWYN